MSLEESNQDLIKPPINCISEKHLLFDSKIVLVHLSLISVHISLSEFVWKPSESFLLSFGIFVFLPYCISVIVSFSFGLS